MGFATSTAMSPAPACWKPGSTRPSGARGSCSRRPAVRWAAAIEPREVTMTTQAFDSARDAVGRIVRDHWKLFLVEGAILVVLGLLAVAGPRVAGRHRPTPFRRLFLTIGVVGCVT